jgi:UDP-N-acetyl-D-mannosaminuronate dehydrogenase
MELYEQFTTKCFAVQQSDKYSEDISELNKILNSVGVSFNSDTVNGVELLTITVDHEKLNKFKTRNAGRGQSDEYRKKVRECKYTVGDIKEMKKSMKHDDIIKLLGVSRASYFRAWKDAQDSPDSYHFLQFK